MYHTNTFTKGADTLVQEITNGNASQRLQLQPKLTQMVDDIQKSGVPVPPQLRNLSEQLLEEAIEARFDNLPV